MWTGLMTIRERASEHLSQLRPAPRRRLIEILDGTGRDGYLALHFENGRLKAFVADRGVPPDDLRRILRQDGSDLCAPLLLVLDERGETWWAREGNGWGAIEAHSDVHARLDRIPEQTLTKGTARRILEAICERNRRLLNDDQVRGLFAPLKRQFARAEYYLFEMLQNAVDDGASHVEVRVEDSEQRLVLQHNGRPFTAVDVYGLSWVGLSGKFGRTIGFMGIGFKAVYKRFTRVGVADQTWKFFFHEHLGQADIDWEVLPVWDDGARDPESPFLCRFTLEEPRGGVARVS